MNLFDIFLLALLPILVSIPERTGALTPLDSWLFIFLTSSPYLDLKGILRSSSISSAIKMWLSSIAVSRSGLGRLEVAGLLWMKSATNLCIPFFYPL